MDGAIGPGVTLVVQAAVCDRIAHMDVGLKVWAAQL